MSQIEKLKAKFNRVPMPNDIRVAEAFRLAEYYGCNVVTGGNHQSKIVHVSTGRVIPIPRHSDVLKEIYVKELKELFEEIEREENK